MNRILFVLVLLILVGCKEEVTKPAKQVSKPKPKVQKSRYVIKGKMPFDALEAMLPYIPERPALKKVLLDYKAEHKKLKAFVEKELSNIPEGLRIDFIFMSHPNGMGVPDPKAKKSQSNVEQLVSSLGYDAVGLEDFSCNRFSFDLIEKEGLQTYRKVIPGASNKAASEFAKSWVKFKRRWGAIRALEDSPELNAFGIENKELHAFHDQFIRVVPKFKDSGHKFWSNLHLCLRLSRSQLALAKVVHQARVNSYKHIAVPYGAGHKQDIDVMRPSYKKIGGRDSDVQ